MGEQVWATQLKGSSFVNVILQDGAVLASCQVEIFCLDPLTGNARWHNPLTGFGLGLATMASESTPGGGQAAVMAEKRRRDDEASASGGAAAISTTG